MPRPLTYAGTGDSLNRIQNEVADEKRFRYTVERNAEQDARQLERDVKTDLRYEAQAERQGRLDEQSILREQRLTENAELSNKLEQLRFDRQTAIDNNAKKLELELEHGTIKANADLREFKTDSPDALVRLKEIYADNYRVMGNPVVKEHFETNRKMAEAAIKTREEAKAARAEYESKRLAEEQKLRGTETFKEGERTINRPVQPPPAETIPSGHPDRKEELARTPAPALVANAPVLTDKAQFDALPSGSFYIRDGKRFQKP